MSWWYKERKSTVITHTWAEAIFFSLQDDLGQVSYHVPLQGTSKYDKNGI
jgi:hypothetical protein